MLTTLISIFSYQYTVILRPLIISYQDLMESQHILVSPTHNTEANGYGGEKSNLLNLWAKFYDFKDRSVLLSNSLKLSCFFNI